MSGLSSYAGIAAVVTGASSGIGKLLAQRLAKGGARVALVARRADRLAELADEIKALGGKPLVLPCDVAERSQVEAAAAQALDEFGSVDLLINNAGYGHHRTFLEWDVEDIERMMRVNYMGTVYWTKALLPQMVERKRGWLIFISSVAGKLGVPEESAYAASKFAIVGLAEALSYEIESAGVHTLTVCPGSIRTDFFDEEALRRMPPVARRMMAEPEGLVDAILEALASGKREITYPRFISSGYVVRALAPAFMRRMTTRQTVAALEKMRGKTEQP